MGESLTVMTESGDPVAASRFTVGAVDGRNIDILLPQEHEDDLAKDIAAGRYAFPRHYYLLLELVPPASKLLDLGGHLGTFTLFAAAHGYRVLTIEASPRNAALLRASLDLNGIEHATVVNRAIGNADGSVKFVQAGPYGHVETGHTDADTVTVRVSRGASLLAEYSWNDVSFIKVDVEGSEVAAFEGLHELLERRSAPAIVYESNGATLAWFGETPLTLRSQLMSLGYDCFQIRDQSLVRLPKTEIQLECNVDCVALKSGVPPGSWTVQNREDPWSRRFFAEQECRSSNSVVRAWVGRALESAEAELLTDFRIIRALNSLKSDRDERVRDSVGWWDKAGWWQKAFRHYARAAARRLTRA